MPPQTSLATETRSTDDAPAAQRTRRYALVILATIATIVFLRYASEVTLPVAFALFALALLFPLYRALAKRLPDGLAAVCALFVFLGALAVIGLGLWQSARAISEKAPEYQAQAAESVEQLRAWSDRHGLPWPSTSGTDASKTLTTEVKRVGRAMSSAFSGLVLTAAFFVLGLLEVRVFRKKIARFMSDDRHGDWMRASERAATSFQRYLVVRTAVGLITGVGVGLAAWAIGLDFPFVWGLANFLLNYIPTLGSIIGVFPPVLFALVQSRDPAYAALALATVGGVQIIMGNYVDPLLQGKYLKLSPVVVLLSVVFWGWVWGIAGAFLSIPLTTAIVLVCQQFERSRWLAELLSAEEAPAGA